MTDALVSLTSFLIVVILLFAPSGLNPAKTSDFKILLALFLFPLFFFLIPVEIFLITVGFWIRFQVLEEALGSKDPFENPALLGCLPLLLYFDLNFHCA